MFLNSDLQPGEVIFYNYKIPISNLIAITRSCPIFDWSAGCLSPPDCQKTVIHIVVKSIWQPALRLNSYFCLKITGENY